MPPPVAPPAATPEAGDLGTVARLGAQRSKWKAAAKALTADRDAQKAKVDDLQKQIDDLKKAGGPEEVAKLKQQLRDTAHKTKFNELAKAAGVDEKALDDIWEKSGYKAEGDAPDEAKIKAAVESQRTVRPFAFTGQAATDGQQQTPDLSVPIPGPGRGQGGTAQNQAGVFGISQEQLRDPAWCFANQGAIAKAAQSAINLPRSQIASKLAIL